MPIHKSSVLCLLAALMLALGSLFPAPARAASAPEIDVSVDATLDRFFRHVRGGYELSQKAAGILVFPRIVKAGFGIGGEYGEGALRIQSRRSSGYYNMLSASIGFQLGVQARSVVIMFMTEEALHRFHRTYGWRVGVDGSVTLVTIGAGGQIDTNELTSPVIGFVFDGKGLMYNLTLEGSKISRISR